MFYHPYITSKKKRFSFKSGCGVQVANGKRHCQLQLKKTIGKAVLAVYITAKGILPFIHY